MQNICIQVDFPDVQGSAKVKLMNLLNACKRLIISGLFLCLSFVIIFPKETISIFSTITITIIIVVVVVSDEAKDRVISLYPVKC